MSIIILIISVAVLVVIAVAALIILGSVRTRGNIARSLEMTLFSFTLPRFAQSAQGGQQKTDKELIAVMEQLYASVATMHIKGFNKFLYGDPYIALEMSVHHVGHHGTHPKRPRYRSKCAE